MSEAAYSVLSFHALCKEKERELCVRERLAEDKLARAETLMRNHSLLKQHPALPPACGPGTGTGTSPVNAGCCPDGDWVLAQQGFADPVHLRSLQL